jgi:hypothetical protein
MLLLADRPGEWSSKQISAAAKQAAEKLRSKQFAKAL